MKKIITMKRFVFCWMLSLFPIFATAQGYQKIVRYIGQEEYMQKGAFLDSAQAVISLGYVTDSNNQHLLVRSDVQGNPVWQRAISDVGNDYTSLDYVCTEGNAIIVGGEGSGDSTAAALACFDAQGNLVWNRIFSYHPDYVSITALAGDHNGNVVFGGQVDEVIFSNSGMVGKLRASDGAPLWMSTIDDSVEFDVACVTATPSGEVIAAGNVSNWPNSTVFYPWIAKWSANGALLWCKKLDYDAYIYGLAADANWIYLAGSEIQSTSAEHLSIGRMTQSGDLDRWQSLDNPNQSSLVIDLKLEGPHLAVLGYVYDDISGNEYGLLMGLDTALNPYFAWRDEFAYPYALAGTDANGLLHFVGSYDGDPVYPSQVLLGAIPNAPISAIPCGMQNYAPSFVSLTPPVLNYPVTTGSTNRSGYAQITPYSLPLLPRTDCIAATAVEEPTAQLQVWPNPTTGRLHMQLPASESNMMVMGLDGKVLLRTQGSGLMELNVSTLAAGMYVLKVETDGQMLMRRFCKVE